MKKKFKTKRRNVSRHKNTAKYRMAKDAVIDYKNLTLLQKYVNDRGKLVPRRISGIKAKEQRLLSTAVKRARFLALLTTGGVKK